MASVAPVFHLLVSAQLLCTPTPARDRVPGVGLVTGTDPVWAATADHWNTGTSGKAKTF
jgi:hypothetical protein